MRRRTALLLSSAVALSCPSAGWGKSSGQSLISAMELAEMRINAHSVSVDSVDVEPINGFVPQVVMGLTNEQDSDDAYSGVEGYGIQSSTPGGSSLPLNNGGTPLYVIATLDSGSAADIISYDATQAYDLAGAGLESSKTTEVEGASGSEDLTNTNALGLYATDFSNASVNNSGAITVTPGSLQGQYNVPALEGNQGDGLPNIMGSPILSQYRVTIQNSQPQHLTVGGVTSQTPKVTLGAFSSTIPTGYSKLTLKAFDSLAGGAETEPAPYYINFDLTGPKNPDTPGSWGALLTNGGVGLARNGTSETNQTFLLDTGAQVSVISNDTAASVGIYNASPANADFTVSVQGVGGITQVPGYYLNTLTLSTQGGLMTWNHVPVIVLDVADPRDPTSALPGILGTNLFSDRDLILNTNVSQTAQTYLAIGPQIMWQHSGSGSWSNSGNWAVALPNGIDTQANFYGAITSAATITVDSPVTVGKITLDNANSYTLSGSNSITLDDSADAAQINVRSGSHTIATPVGLASDTTVTVIPPTSTLTMSGRISSPAGAYGITMDGSGTLLLTGSSTYAGPTDVVSGTLAVTGSIASPLVTVDATNAPANLVLGGANALASGAQLIGLGGGSFAPTITVNASQSFASLNSTGTTTFASGAITVGPIDGTGALAVTGASLTASHIRQNSLSVGSLSTVSIADSAAPGSNTAISVVTDLYNSGTVNLHNNALIVNDPTQGSSVIAAVFNAADFNPDTGSNRWDKPGITSSSAAANAGNYALGYLTSANIANLGSTTFQGQPVSSNSTVVAYTLIGDTELRGTVDGTDYNNVLANYDTAGDWSEGNFYNESYVGGDDYNAVLNAYDVAAAGGAKGLKPAITRSLTPALSPVATSGTFHLEVNTTSGDVVIFNDSTSSAPLTLYNIVDGSQQDLLIGNPADGNGTSTSINSGSAPYTNEHFLSVAGNDSNAVASITGRSSTNYKAWSLVLDGYNSNATALALSEGGTANKTDTINVPSYYSIDLGDIFNVGTTTVALTFQWGTETSAGGEGGTVYSNQPIDYVGTPEPASLGLLGLGGLAMMRRRRTVGRKA